MNSFRILFAATLSTAGCVAVDNIDGLGGEPEDLEVSLDEALDELVDKARPQVADGGYAVLLFDKTVSMNKTRSATGNTRCTDAKIMAQGAVLEFFNPAIEDGDGLAIWTFRNSGSSLDDVQPVQSAYYTDAPTALAAINSISCNGITPLADAMCKGLNGDGETFTLSPPPTRMLVLTDGWENASNGPCDGPSGDSFNPGTWQNNVLMEMLATGIRVDTRYWVADTILALEESIDDLTIQDDPISPIEEELQMVADAEGLPRETVEGLTAEASVMQAGCDTYCQEFKFFSDLAAFSGGTMGVVGDGDSNYPAQDTIDPPSGPVLPPSGGGGIWW